MTDNFTFAIRGFLQSLPAHSRIIHSNTLLNIPPKSLLIIIHKSNNQSNTRVPVPKRKAKKLYGCCEGKNPYNRVKRPLAVTGKQRLVFILHAGASVEVVWLRTGKFCLCRESNPDHQT
jgi:hypothetical protein